MGNSLITGVVQADEGRIRLKVKGLRGLEQDVDAIINTGYTGSLTLPPALIAALGLRWQTVDRVTLADGSECIFEVYEAKVMWDGKVRRILVDEADADPLVGMRLLKRSRIENASSCPRYGHHQAPTSEIEPWNSIRTSSTMPSWRSSTSGSMTERARGRVLTGTQ